MSTPESGHQESHQCDCQGITIPRDFTINEHTPLAEDIIECAVYAVTLEAEKAYRDREMAMLKFAKDRMAPGSAHELHRLYLELEALSSRISIRATKLAIQLTQSLPARLSTIDAMSRATLVNAGFCCQDRIDQWVKETLGETEGQRQETKETPAGKETTHPGRFISNALIQFWLTVERCETVEFDQDTPGNSHAVIIARGDELPEFKLDLVLPSELHQKLKDQVEAIRSAGVVQGTGIISRTDEHGRVVVDVGSWKPGTT